MPTLAEDYAYFAANVKRRREKHAARKRARWERIKADFARRRSTVIETEGGAR
jgi:hypothetical protein